MELNDQQLARRFAALTPEGRRGFLEKLGELNLSFSELPIVAADRDSLIPVSYAQYGLWLTWKLDPQSPAYNMPGMMHFKGALNIDALLIALQNLVARHETLRTIFAVGYDGEPHQVILSPDAFECAVVDLRQPSKQSKPSKQSSNDELRKLQQGFALTPFNLDQAPPLRARLWQIGDDDYVLGVVLHHVAGDGASVRVLVDELLSLYQFECGLCAEKLCPIPVQFADYVIWQRNWFEAGEKERQLVYWQTSLGDEHPPLNLPFDRPRGAAQNGKEDRHQFHLPADLSDKLKALAQAQSASLFMVMLALLKLLLCRFSGQSDVRVGAPIADRRRSETRGLIACLTNVLVLRTQIETTKTFSDLLDAVRETVLEAHAHADLPFELLVEVLQPERQPGVHPLFQVKCTQQDELQSLWHLPDLEIEIEGLSAGHAHFDLSLDFIDRYTGVEAVFLYSRALFDEATITRFAKVFIAFAGQVVKNVDVVLNQLALGEPSTCLQGEVSSFDADVLELWNASVQGFPDRNAVCYKDRSYTYTYTYAELDQHVDLLAAELVARGVAPEVRVGIHSDRSCEFIVGMLAVLKVGGTYVPLDPSLPKQRLIYQLQDSGAVLLLSTEDLSWSPGLPVLLFDLNIDRKSFIPVPAVTVHSNQAAYIIYTSGSTGSPKGVVISRGALANYIPAVLERMALPESANSMAMVSTVAADLGHTVLFGTLCSGRTLHLISPELTFDPDAFAGYMKEHQIDVLKIVPGHLQALLHAANPEDVLPATRLILGGEATGWPLLASINTLKPACQVLNHYGPTETTVGILTQYADKALRTAATLPVGKPLANCEVHVLDADLNPVPLGVAGELYLNGIQVARGYQGQSGQTAERLIASPFNSGERLYRSGDRVKMLKDGTLEFLGRVDDQVKVRGYRVELGEVTRALREQPGVAEAEVIARVKAEGPTKLYGYVVASRDVSVDADVLRQALVSVLPDYMVPDAIALIDSLPRTANGKLDRNALPDPELESGSDYKPPQGEVEEILAAIWAEALGVEKVGRTDNFFALGGDSILTLQIVARARKQGLKLLPKQLMELQTIAAIGTMVKQIDPVPSSGQFAGGDEVAASEPFDLTPIQRCFVEQEFEDLHHWNQSVMLTLTEAPDLLYLRQAVEAVVAHHSALRLQFTAQEGVWNQAVVPQNGSDAVSLFKHIDLSSAQQVSTVITMSADKVQKSLSLDHPFKVVWMDLGPRKPGRLLLVAHHLVVDGVSWRILLEDLQTAYRQLCNSQTVQLPSQTTSFRQWSQVLTRFAQSESLKAELPYWQSIVAHNEPGLPGHAEGRNCVADAKTIELSLGEALTEQLLTEVSQAYRTQINDILLTALARTLCAWDGRDSVLVELEGHGREELEEGIDLSRTVGWFTSLFPVRLTPTSELDSSIKSIKEQLRSVPRKGIGYGALRYLAADDRRLVQAAHPQVTFNYLGQFDQSFDANSLWRVARESVGQQRSPSGERRTWLDINAAVHRGELGISWTYSAGIHDESVIQTLSERFRDELQALIEHCTSGVIGVTPSDFPLARVSQEQLEELPIPWCDLVDLYPLSPMQAGMLFHSAYSVEGSGLQEGLQGAMYVNQLRVDLGNLDVTRFKAAWMVAFSRHDNLRTGFLSGEAGLQWVARAVELPFIEKDCCEPDGDGSIDALDELARTEQERGFDLKAPPLMRLVLVRLSADRHHLIWTRHHLLLDGWSTGRLLTEVLSLYSGGQPPPPQGRFRDYIAWLQGCDHKASERYWRSLLKGMQEPTLLAPSVASRVAGAGYCQHSYLLSAEQTERMKVFAREERVTLNTLVQAVWALLLQRYTGQRTVIFGATTSGRPSELPGVENLLGLFINTIPVVAEPRPEQQISDWLRELQAQNLASREYEYTPLHDIQRWADSGGQSLFDNIIVFENYPVEDSFQQAGSLNLVVENVHSDSGNHYPVTLRVVLGNELRFDYLYDTNHIDTIGAQQLARQFAGLLHDLTEALGDASHRQLCVLALPETTDEVLGEAAEFNSLDHFVLARWNQMVLLAGDTPALADDLVEYSHQVLDQAADVLAAQLIAKGVIRGGVDAEPRIALHAERSCEYVLGLLAILKAGGVFVPLDPALPAERLQYQINDSGVALVLTTDPLDWDPGVPVLSLDWPDPSVPVLATPSPVIHPDQAAYVIYTSGSTGQPKGVVVSHGALANYVYGVLTRLSLSGEVRQLAMVSTVAADLGHTLLFGALCSGRTLHLMSSELAFDPDAFADYMRRYHIDAVKLVPSHLQALLSAASPADVLPDALLILGGEACRWSLLEQIGALKPGCRVINHYGPTETTVGVLTQDAEQADRGAATLPMGRPLVNCRAYVLDGDMLPVPMGAIGELYLGGAQLARGYQRRSGQTAERFVASPFENGARLYRSGDRVKVRGDGTLEFLGRADDQVKVRGYRVELKEVARSLESETGVAQAEVVTRVSESGQMKLCGYVVPDYIVPGVNVSLDPEQLIAQLAGRLPGYMVPEAIVVLDALPLTANGKLDWRALPEPGAQNEDGYIAPEGGVECLLAEVWAEVLGIERVGRYDNFFALGGDSILSLKVVARARKRGLTLAPKQLFEQQSLQALAQAVDGGDEDCAKDIAISPNNIPEDCQAIRPDMLTLVELDSVHVEIIEAAVPGGGVNIQDIYPLTSLQEGMLFHHMLQVEGDAYLTSRLLSFDSRERLETFIVHLNRVISRQDTLRTAVLWESLPEPVQVVYRRAELILDWQEAPEGVDVAEWLSARFHPSHYRLDVRHAPMLHTAAVFDAANQRWLLDLLIHHLIEDNTTIKRVVEEISLLQQGREAELTDPVPFRNYVARLKLSDSKDRHEAFFRKMLGDIDEPTAPFNVMDVHGDGSGLDEVIVPLENDLSLTVRQCSRELGISAASFFHLAWALVLSKTTGQEDVVFGTVLFGRMHHAEATEDAAGIYMNTLPVRFGIDHKTVGDSLQRTHQQLVELFQHEHASLSLAQRCSAITGGTPLFTSLLNFRYGTQVVDTLGPDILHGAELLSSRARTNYPIGIWVDDLGDGFSLQAQVHNSIGAERLCHYLINALQQMVDVLRRGAQTTLRELTVFDRGEHERMLGLGAGRKNYETKCAIHVRFERQVEQRPEAIALRFGKERLSYSELNCRANRLAHYLIELGVQPETKVGIAVDRSIEMVVGVLAILKAGGAYVPLDPEYPRERLAYMVKDSAIALLLTQDDLRQTIPVSEGKTVIALDRIQLGDRPATNPVLSLSGDNLAYVIYTSGSTGTPKGAQLCHSNVIRLLQGTEDWFQFGPEDVWTLFHSYAFDFSVWELFGALCSGGALVIVPYWVSRSPEDFLELLREQRVTVLNQTPSAFSQLVQLAQTYEQALALRLVIFGGEALEPERLRPWIQHWGHDRPQLVNMYGITETTVHVTCRRITQADLGESRSPVGVAIPDLGLRILDSALQLVPVGVPGELYVSGAGLARGYLSRAGLTSESFVADPCGGSGGRLYRTGDLVRWDADGQLEYLGRIDQQVKIRGFRIELGEVEAQLLIQTEVKDAVVVARQGPSGSRLVAYITTGADTSGQHATASLSHLRDRLATVLPEYMVPSAIVMLDTLPLTANGKVDYRALPELGSDKDCEAPQGEVEEALARIWIETLNVQRVSRRDSFFELGGDSLVTVKVRQRVKQQFALDLPLRLFFEKTTLLEMSGIIQTEIHKQTQFQSQQTKAMVALLDSLES